MAKQHIFTQMIPDRDEPALYINPRSEQIAAFAEEAVTVEDQPKVRLSQTQMKSKTPSTASSQHQR